MDENITPDNLNYYLYPSRWQVGHFVDVGVGHIDQFKFMETFQVDYHLRNAGFLENQEKEYQ